MTYWHELTDEEIASIKQNHGGQNYNGLVDQLWRTIERKDLPDKYLYEWGFSEVYHSNEGWFMVRSLPGEPKGSFGWFYGHVIENSLYVSLRYSYPGTGPEARIKYLLRLKYKEHINLQNQLLNCDKEIASLKGKLGK